MRYFVVPDVHGRADLARIALDAAGVARTAAERAAAGVTAVQLGDLANCVYPSVSLDVDALTLGRDWFDVILVGNHEYPHFAGPRFAGFYADEAVRLLLDSLDRRGILRPCLLAGDTLLTHAGVTPEWGWASARDADAALRAAWTSTRLCSLFSQIGQSRGGRAENGGVLWSDFDEPRARFSQVHGHSIRRDGPHRHDLGDAFVYNLDVGMQHSGRAVGLWLNEDGRPDGLVDVPPEGEA